MVMLRHPCLHISAKGRFRGIPVARGAHILTHLSFADDCMVFCKVDVYQAQGLASILAKYQEFSGQRVNLAKSSIFFSRNTPVEVKNGKSLRVQDHNWVPWLTIKIQRAGHIGVAGGWAFTDVVGDQAREAAAAQHGDAVMFSRLGVMAREQLGGIPLAVFTAAAEKTKVGDGGDLRVGETSGGMLVLAARSRRRIVGLAGGGWSRSGELAVKDARWEKLHCITVRGKKSRLWHCCAGFGNLRRNLRGSNITGGGPSEFVGVAALGSRRRCCMRGDGNFAKGDDGD
ncbi:phosphoenolpyruvate carboxykinase [Striga asiatica]|uniref:Phosphoenolpyruvate carboxykinase n=1 Tax=Striga asiatica TaxID=4170 RepID=A0A5A7RDS2_STRAF|nr:phosphoenolpyruvate carboxykinase [Striga asiatica]